MITLHLKSRVPVSKACIIYFFLLFCLAGLSFDKAAVYAGEKYGLSRGETLYVPAYSHIYTGNRETPSSLTVTLSIRNTDLVHGMRVTKVDYHRTQGEKLKAYITKPVLLPPLGSIRYVVPHKDKAGGSGANFIITWEADQPINPPIVESIMTGDRTSFSSRGQVLILP